MGLLPGVGYDSSAVIRPRSAVRRRACAARFGDSRSREMRTLIVRFYIPAHSMLVCHRVLAAAIPSCAASQLAADPAGAASAARGRPERRDLRGRHGQGALDATADDLATPGPAPWWFLRRPGPAVAYYRQQADAVRA